MLTSVPCPTPLSAMPALPLPAPPVSPLTYAFFPTITYLFYALLLPFYYLPAIHTLSLAWLTYHGSPHMPAFPPMYILCKFGLFLCSSCLHTPSIPGSHAFKQRATTHLQLVGLGTPAHTHTYCYHGTLYTGFGSHHMATHTTFPTLLPTHHCTTPFAALFVPASACNTHCPFVNQVLFSYHWHTPAMRFFLGTGALPCPPTMPTHHHLHYLCAPTTPSPPAPHHLPPGTLISPLPAFFHTPGLPGDLPCSNTCDSPTHTGPTPGTACL